ncbi:MAG: right-handed parallel beta-helix repeat-containing protein, partial [Pseudobdellovibrionaceae bacterium]
MKFTSFCKTLDSFKLFLILLIALLIAPRGQAATYYVSTSGNDSNPGSLSLPWRTIGKAANTLVAGDTVNIRGGTYNEQVTPKNSGSQGAFIVYTAYPGETVTIDASGLGFSWSGIFNINSRSYIQVSGLRLVNSPGYGVYIMSSNNIRILNNYTYKTIYSGIGAYNSDTLTIDGNEIALANNGGGSQESLSIVTTQHYTVSHNRVHGGGKEGIDAKVGSSNGKIFGNVVYDMARVGIYVDAWDSTTNNIEIYNNTVSDSQSADSGASQDGIRVGGERGGTASNIKIYNNVIYNIVWTGVSVSNWFESGFSEPKFDTLSIYNNTIYNTGTRSGGGVQVQGSQNKGVTIYNNIISKARSFNIQASLATINNNLFDGGSSSGSAAIMGSPLFVNAGSDFHLQAGS